MRKRKHGTSTAATTPTVSSDCGGHCESATGSERADVLTPAQRIRCMSHVRSRNTGPELILRRALWRQGARYRLNSKLTGKPDLLFPSAHLAVFVDGCFWHGCPLHAAQPKTNAMFWRAKLEANKRRDIVVNATLAAEGWRVLRVWQHELRDVNAAAARVLAKLSFYEKG